MKKVVGIATVALAAIAIIGVAAVALHDQGPSYRWPFKQRVLFDRMALITVDEYLYNECRGLDERTTECWEERYRVQEWQNIVTARKACQPEHSAPEQEWLDAVACYNAQLAKLEEPAEKKRKEYKDLTHAG